MPARVVVALTTRTTTKTLVMILFLRQPPMALQRRSSVGLSVESPPIIKWRLLPAPLRRFFLEKCTLLLRAIIIDRKSSHTSLPLRARNRIHHGARDCSFCWLERALKKKRTRTNAWQGGASWRGASQVMSSCRDRRQAAASVNSSQKQDKQNPVIASISLRMRCFRWLVVVH